MLLFILGAIVGGIVGFFVCAICSVSSTQVRTESQHSKKAGEKNAPSK